MRGRKLEGIKFRRQYPIEPWIVDFACVKQKLVVELDGGYHDYTYERDLARQKHLESAGWQVIRFRNDDVLENVEAVAIAITRFLGAENVLEGGN